MCTWRDFSNLFQIIIRGMLKVCETILELFGCHVGDVLENNWREAHLKENTFTKQARKRTLSSLLEVKLLSLFTQLGVIPHSDANLDSNPASAPNAHLSLGASLGLIAKKAAHARSLQRATDNIFWCVFKTYGHHFHIATGTDKHTKRTTFIMLTSIQEGLQTVCSEGLLLPCRLYVQMLICEPNQRSIQKGLHFMFSHVNKYLHIFHIQYLQ